MRQPIKLSMQELLDISQDISRLFSPYISIRGTSKTLYAAFSAPELLAISQEISRDYAPLAAQLPPTLVLMPVEPDRLHVYWRLEKNPMPDKSETGELKPLILKIYNHAQVLRQPESNAPLNVDAEPCLEVLLDAAKSQQDVPWPAEMHNSGQLSAVIGYQDSEQEFKVLQRSNRTEMPRLQSETENGIQLGGSSELMIGGSYEGLV
ncbi:MAG: DUF4912 domain-containing protein [Methylomonas sp.]